MIKNGLCRLSNFILIWVFLVGVVGCGVGELQDSLESHNPTTIILWEIKHVKILVLLPNYLWPWINLPCTWHLPGLLNTPYPTLTNYPLSPLVSPRMLPNLTPTPHPPGAVSHMLLIWLTPGTHIRWPDIYLQTFGVCKLWYPHWKGKGVLKLCYIPLLWGMGSVG